MSLETYLFFLTASFFLWITPGQDTLYILARSISQGKVSGIVSALGIGTGALFHATLTTLGISFIILTSPLLFLSMKVIGGLYLIYLGFMALSSKNENKTLKNLENSKLSKIYIQGILTNIFNPKVALFFIAFIPQFIDNNASTSILALLSYSFVFGGTLWCILIALFASSFSKKIVNSSFMDKYLDKFTGSIYIYLGINLLKSKI